SNEEAVGAPPHRVERRQFGFISMRARTPAAFLVLLLLSVHSMGQSRPRSELDWSFKFQDFSTQSVYKGRPARPLLATETDRLFRSTIRQASQKGPNFAGQYAIAHW